MVPQPSSETRRAAAMIREPALDGRDPMKSAIGPDVLSNPAQGLDVVTAGEVAALSTEQAASSEPYRARKTASGVVCRVRANMAATAARSRAWPPGRERRAISEGESLFMALE